MICWCSERREGGREVTEGLILSHPTSDVASVISDRLGVGAEGAQGPSPDSPGSPQSAAGGRKAGRLRWELVALVTEYSLKRIYS